MTTKKQITAYDQSINPNSFYRKSEVVRRNLLFGYSLSTLDEKIANGEIDRPVKLSSHTIGWFGDTILKMQAAGGKFVNENQNVRQTDDLYRWFNAEGILLYVGISFNAWKRACQHRNNVECEWWEQVTSMTIQHYSTREEAACAEAEAIRNEKPLYNKAGTGGRTLSAMSVQQLRHKPGRYHDGGEPGRGLYLQVGRYDTKQKQWVKGGASWALRYEVKSSTHSNGRRDRWLGLGALVDFSLKEARARARAARQLLADGIDPLDQKSRFKATMAGLHHE